MNTKRRLSDDLSNDSEILSEKRFVKIQMKFVEYMEKIERMRVYKDN